jgi:hypothetical protein
MTDGTEHSQERPYAGMDQDCWDEFKRVVLQLSEDPEFDGWIRSQDPATFGSREFWREFADVASRRWHALGLRGTRL